MSHAEVLELVERNRSRMPTSLNEWRLPDGGSTSQATCRSPTQRRPLPAFSFDRAAIAFRKPLRSAGKLLPYFQ